MTTGCTLCQANLSSGQDTERVCDSHISCVRKDSPRPKCFAIQSEHRGLTRPRLHYFSSRETSVLKNERVTNVRPIHCKHRARRCYEAEACSWPTKVRSRTCESRSEFCSDNSLPNVAWSTGHLPCHSQQETILVDIISIPISLKGLPRSTAISTP